MVLLVTTLSHYLNGGIRMQGPRPRVRPAVKAHLSVILGLIALTKAVGYYLARFNLDLSSNGFVQGAGYTDVHARLPGPRAAHPGVAGRGAVSSSTTSAARAGRCPSWASACGSSWR